MTRKMFQFKHLAYFLSVWLKYMRWERRSFHSSTSLHTSFLCDCKILCEKGNLSISVPCIDAFFLSVRLRGIPDQTKCWLGTERKIIAEASLPSAWSKVASCKSRCPVVIEASIHSLCSFVLCNRRTYLWNDIMSDNAQSPRTSYLHSPLLRDLTMQSSRKMP